jgi:hypothetical protein
LLWGLTAGSAIITVALGYLHLAEGGFDEPSAAAHRFYGTAVAIVTAVIWLGATRLPEFYQRLSYLPGIASLALLTITGHYGGRLTHGASYLIDYAPQRLRSVAGLAERAAPMAGTAAQLDMSGSAAAMTVNAELIDRLFEAGFIARRVAASDPRLIVSARSPGSPVGADRLAVLIDGAESIVELKLDGAGLGDAELAIIGGLPLLQKLNVANNEISSAGLTVLVGHDELAELNLYGNGAVTSAAQTSLSEIPSLRKLFVWQTGLSSQDIEELRLALPGLEIQGAGVVQN